MKRSNWGAAFAATFLVLGCSGADGKDGAPGAQGPEGDAGLPGSQGATGDAGTVPSLTSEVSGTVTSDGTTPLPGVTVTASPGPATATATTDATGAFSIKNLDIGAYELTFHLTGYTDQTVPVALNLSGPTTVTVVLALDKDGAVAPVGPTVAVTDQLSVGYSAAVTVMAAATGTGPFTYAWTQASGLPVTLTGATSNTITFTTPDFPTSMGSTATTTAPQITYARFGVLGINPDQAGHSTFTVTVTDANGLITKATVEVDSSRPTTGLRDVPVGVPVHLQGDATYLFVPVTPVCASNTDCPTAASTCNVAKATCGCTTDANCGGVTSGLYCKTGVCTAGCNITGVAGNNGCPGGLTCSATAAKAGSCAGPQTAWSWTLDVSAAPGSTSTLTNATSQFPTFTPDQKAIYKATETVSGQTITIYAGKWVGEMTSDYTPPAATCDVCHTAPPNSLPTPTSAPDIWQLWKTTDHATALQRKLDGSAGVHFGEACLQCHTVGYDKTATNGGFDDVEATSGWTFPAVPATYDPTSANWTTLVSNATQGPLAGIQCENCHGPQEQPTGGPHPGVDPIARISWSSEVCASCHQENPQHYFPSQWDTPGVNWVGHANRDVAIREGSYERMPASTVAATGLFIPQGNNLKYCGRCHSAQGFAQFAQQINAGEYGFLTNDNAPLNAGNHPATGLELKAKGMALATIEPQTCQACHDPHFSDPTTALHQLRIYDKVPAIPNGMSNVTGMGTGAICIACHNGRNGEHSDFAQNTIDFATGKYLAQPTLVAFPTEHDGPQAEMMFGFSAYFMARYNPSAHLAVADTCAGCHVKIATGSDIASMQTSNHSFKVDSTICATCHGTGSTAVDGVALQAANQVQIDSIRGLLASKMLTTIVSAINNVPATGAMVVAVRPYDLTTDSYSSATSSYAGGAVPAGWTDLVASKNTPTSVGMMYSKTGTYLVVLNVPNAVTFTPTATGAAPVTTSALAVSFTSIGTNQAVPNTVPGWPTAGAYFYSVWGAPSPVSGSTTVTFPTVPQPAWLTATPTGVSSVQTLMKAYWNISVLNNDGTQGIHNPSFFNGVISATSAALEVLP